MADRILTDAAKVKDPDAKAALLEIASRYDWLAQWAARNQPRNRD